MSPLLPQALFIMFVSGPLLSSTRVTVNHHLSLDIKSLSKATNNNNYYNKNKKIGSSIITSTTLESSPNPDTNSSNMTCNFLLQEIEWMSFLHLDFSLIIFFQKHKTKLSSSIITFFFKKANMIQSWWRLKLPVTPPNIQFSIFLT